MSTGPVLAGVILAGLLLAALLLSRVRLAVDVSAKGRADEDVLAFVAGASVWPLTATACAAAGTLPEIAVRLGRFTIRRTLFAPDAGGDRRAREEAPTKDAAARATARIFEVDPLDAADLVVGAACAVAIEHIDLRAQISADDPVWNGHAAAAFAMVSAALAPFGTVSADVDWVSPPFADLALDARFRVTVRTLVSSAVVFAGRTLFRPLSKGIRAPWLRPSP